MHQPIPANDVIREWTGQTLDGTISKADFIQLRARLIICSRARQEFNRAVRLHKDLLAACGNAPPHLKQALESACSLTEAIESN